MALYITEKRERERQRKRERDDSSSEWVIELMRHVQALGQNGMDSNPVAII